MLGAACADAEITEFGLTCSEDEPCAVYVELASIEAAGGKIYLAGNFHTESTTLWSLLMMSEDEGRTWIEVEKRLRSVALDQIQFADNATGFVSGRTAGALARDPFFFRTTDGGKSWKRLPLFEEGSVGLIESFHFDSPTHGLVTVDRGRPGAGRYALLESSSAGDAWTTRESGSARRRSVAGAPQTSWRITTEAATKSFRIERRAGESWQKTASFAVQAGQCRPAPVSPVEPPSGQVN